MLVHSLLFLASACLQLVGAVTILGSRAGVNLQTGETPLRQDIRILQTLGPAFDLYILALQQLTKQDQSSPLSYYQVAGIHGLPHIEWDGVSGQYSAGYCPHTSILFPTWHRPYLALFEQLLSDNAQQIADQYPPAQQSQYQSAAQTLRVPYWDWASNATMPDVVSQPTVSINTPRGPSEIANPLYNYTFHPHPSSSDFPPISQLSSLNSTVRCPDSNGQSQPDVANAQLSANGEALRSLVYQLITQESEYAPFSNTASQGQFNSIENVHNAIHAFVGGSGHMAIVPFSAFDPVFWLHHANVDRLVAIWQAIYPDSWISTSQVNLAGTYTDEPGAPEDGNSTLTPFHSDDFGGLYTSISARYTRSFGYSYPETIDWNVTPNDLSSAVRAKVNTLYGPTPTNNSLRRRRQFAPRIEYQWYARFSVEKREAIESFLVHVFLGAVSNNSSTWSYAKNLAGSQAFLIPATSANATMTGTARGQIPLNKKLEYSGIPCQSAEPVLQHLTSSLTYALQYLNGTEMDAPSVPSFRFYATQQMVKPATLPDEFPIYMDSVNHNVSTSGYGNRASAANFRGVGVR